MEDTIQDLARRVAACKHWRWLPGMRVLRSDMPQNAFRLDEFEPVIPGDGCLPDLRDSATLGAFVEAVRLAHGAHVVWLQPSRQTWGWDARAQMPDEHFVTLGTSRTGAEALVAALEAAP